MADQITLPEIPYPLTLNDAWRWSVSRNAERPFLIDWTRELTYAEADDASDIIAAGLMELGVTKGAKVGVLMPNSPDWIVCWLAVSKVGGVCVPLSTFYKAPELDWALRHNDVHTLLMIDRFLGQDYLARLDGAVSGLKQGLPCASHPFLRNVVVWGGGSIANGLTAADLRERGAVSRFRAVLPAAQSEVTPSDDFLIVTTSGSTATPKAVLHTHGGAMLATTIHNAMVDVRPTDRLHTGHPLFWIASYNLTIMPAIFTGAALCFSPTPRPADVVRTIKDLQVTRLILHPSQTPPLIQSAPLEDFASLRLLEGCASSEEAIQRLSAFGGVMFGMTEAFGPHTMEAEWAVFPPDKAGSAGRAIATMERIIADPATGERLPAGAVGELRLRGPTLMRGYYKRPLSDAFTKDGFLRTGDLGFIDEDGYFTFTARLSEMIKCSGANVAPGEVEAVLAALPGVQEAIVMGMKDAQKGEAVGAVVVFHPGHAPDVEALRTALSERLSSYKVPSRWFTLAFEDIPRTASHKVDKPALRRLLAERR